MTERTLFPSFGPSGATASTTADDTSATSATSATSWLQNSSFPQHLVERLNSESVQGSVKSAIPVKSSESVKKGKVLPCYFRNFFRSLRKVTNLYVWLFRNPWYDRLTRYYFFPWQIPKEEELIKSAQRKRRKRRSIRNITVIKLLSRF